ASWWVRRSPWPEPYSKNGAWRMVRTSSGSGSNEEHRRTMPPMALNNPASATAIVLAGGRSSRMGTSKALLLFENQPLIVHVVATLRHLFSDVVVVTALGQELPSLPATLVCDEVAYQGPVGGIYYGLMATRGDAAFVTSCDSVFLNLDLISHLVSQIPEHDVVVPHWQGRFQPLHAV